VSKFDDYVQRKAQPLIATMNQKFLTNTTGVKAGQPFLGQKTVSSDGTTTTITDAQGNVFTGLTIGSPNAVDASVVLNSTTAAQVNEYVIPDDQDATGGAYVAFQYKNHNYVRKVNALIDPESEAGAEILEDVISLLDEAFLEWSTDQAVFLTNIDQPSLPTNANNYIAPPMAFYPQWSQYQASDMVYAGSDAINFIPFPIPENMLDPRIKPDDYIVLFTSNGKHMMFGGAYCDRMPDPNFPDADGHVHVQFVIYQNFKLTYNTDTAETVPQISSSDWLIGSTLKKDGITPVVQSYDLNLAFDGYSKPPQQQDQASGTAVSDPRRSSIFLYVPGELVPNTGSGFQPEVGGSFSFSGDGQFTLVSNGSSTLIGSHQAVYNFDPATLLQTNQIAWAFNNDSNGNPHLDCVAVGINTCAYYLSSNVVEQNMTLNYAYADDENTVINASCLWGSDQNAIFDWYFLPHDWVGNYQSIVLTQYQVGVLNTRPDWQPPSLGSGYPYSYQGITWVNAGESPTNPLPDINQGMFGGVPYIHEESSGSGHDGAGEPYSGFDGDGDIGPSYDPSFGNFVGSLIYFDGVFSAECIGFANGGGDSGQDPTLLIGDFAGSGVYHFFDGAEVTFTDPPVTGGFCTDPCFSCEYNNIFACWGTIDFFPTPTLGSNFLGTFETNVYSAQDIQKTNADQSNTDDTGPIRIIQAFANVGQNDQRTIVNAFRSVAGNPALLYTFSAGARQSGVSATADSEEDATDLLTDILDNIDALADGQYVPGLSGTGGTTGQVNAPDGNPIYWEAVVPYGTGPQSISPNGLQAPDGFVITDQWYFPKGTYPYAYQALKAEDSSYFLSYVTGYYVVDGAQQTDGEGNPITFEFMYEFNIVVVDGEATLNYTGKNIQGELSGMSLLVGTTVGSTSGADSGDGDPSDNQILAGLGDSGSIGGGSVALPENQISGSLNPPGAGTYAIQDYILLGGGGPVVVAPS
jgi:hypothetical protein